ncbi:1,2-phenylacetyl-CoA epoxidase subunit PaaD [Pseudalkalibacillus caeni]|uniref:Phenylacetate-CoA oxygenase subunit PaaJ n=1 Tax=Exobacillus caeni TaxID=2574798 RepID=A0A5R9F6Y0_9BACL|nr:1,2-phenylacetyl-CoA epoxidase subunit PaaD [Pseudalkalibacillus caeni]TLS38096.1 phenylacetate-CoA oxygenase subunit PaaJ [Pseudalkalibacillus caeni]
MITSDRLKETVYRELKKVEDPEITSVSILDLGMVDDVIVQEKEAVIQVLPTFSGCPALDLIKKRIEEAALKVGGVETVNVQFVYDPPWTTDRITEEGREQLKQFGIAPPPSDHIDGEPWHVDCPYCGSTYTTMENIFGPTACRSILYCKSCKNPFEAMKPVANL